MKRKKGEVLHWHVWIVMFVLTAMVVYTAEGARQGQREGARQTRKEGGLYPLLLSNTSHRLGDGPRTISRPHVYNMRRLLSVNGTTAAPASEKSIWEEISDFYSDSNNMAMYCVLPILVLIYGGCSAIYCIHKCRRYIRRRRHKRQHTDREGLVEEDERNDLNQEGGDCLTGSERQPIKTVSASSWDDNTAAFADVSGYNVQRKKTPLPWDTPQEIQRDDSFAEKDTRRSRETNYSTGSRESSANVLQHERDKLENEMEGSPAPPHRLRDQSEAEAAVKEEEGEDRRPPPRNITTTTYMTTNPPPPPRAPTTITQINEANRQPPANPRPIEIVPISRKEYQQRMEANAWDPLHQRPFESRAGAESERRGGRESAWSIRDEIMAKYDALTSLAMAKKTADVLRFNSEDPNLDNSGGGGGGGHYPDTLRRKPGGGKKKLIFIAE